MRLLLDTHIAFWLALKPAALSSGERETLADPGNDLFVPSIAIWELQIKWEKRFVSGERKGAARPLDVLHSLESLGLQFIDLTAALAATELHQPPVHKDPFHIMLLTIAQENGMKLLTRDRDLAGHPLVLTAT